MGRNDHKDDNFDDIDNTFVEKENENSKSSPQPDYSSNVSPETEISPEKENAQIGEQIEAKPVDVKKDTSDSKFFAVRTTGGQEHVVINMAQNKISSKNVAVRSILLLESFKGYIIVEAPNSNIAYEALSGIRHVKGQIRGELPYKDIEGYLVKRPIVTELSIDDTVEVVAGPFKSMKAKITRVDYEKQEATVLLLDSPYQIPVTVDANYLKKMPL